MEAKSPQRPGGAAKLIHKLRHFRSGKLYKSCQRRWARLTGRPLVHFLHVRKAGGTAIKNVLVAHATAGPNLIACHPHRITVQDIPVGEKFLFAVRDPVSRYVSGFLSRLHQGAPAHFVPWTADEKLAFARFQTPNELGLALASADADTRGEAERAMAAISHVRSSYWDWFLDEATLRQRAGDVLIVLRQRHLDEDFRQALRLLQLPADLRLSDDPAAANRSPQDESRRLEPEAEQAIRAYYARDYQFLELCRELFGLQGEP